MNLDYTLDDLITQVCEALGLNIDQVTGPNNARELSDARKIIVKLAIDMKLARGWAHMGRYLNRDHATMIYNYRQAKTLMDHDQEFKSKLSKMASVIGFNMNGRVLSIAFDKWVNNISYY